MVTTAEDVFVLHCEAPLTLASATDIRTRMASALDHHASIVVAVPAAADIDLTFIQILVAANRTASSAGRSFRLDAPSTGGVFAALGSAGLCAGDIPARGGCPVHAVTPAATLGSGIDL